MITPTHMLMGGALFRSGRRTALAGVAGGLLPDVPSFVLVGWAALGGRGAEEIFRTLYFSDRWQLIMAPSHSAPLWGLAFVAALVLRARAAVAFTASGLLHLLTDFLLHADDPHRHFWPLNDWRFHSPVSYWDPRYGGFWFGPVEIALVVVCSAVLVRRFPARWLKGVLALLVVIYIAQYAAALSLLPDQL